MICLVAGSAGFIGSHLCERLLKEGHHVVGIDNFSTGAKANVDYLEKTYSRYSHIKSDIENPAWLQSASVKLPWAFDVVFHLASPASPSYYLKHPIPTIHANTNGTEVLLNFAQIHGARFLYASTSEIYGDPLVHPQPETYNGNVNPCGVRSVYDEAKRMGETLVMTYHRYKNVDTRIVRIFNTYGPRMQPDDGRVVPNFIMQALQSKPLTVYGDGTQTRSLCYIDDLVDGLLAVLRQPDAMPFNVGNPHEITMLELAETVLDLIPTSKSRIVFEPLPEDDPRQRNPVITKLQKYDWSPRVSLETGLSQTIKHMKRQLAPPPLDFASIQKLLSSTKSDTINSYFKNIN